MKRTHRNIAGLLLHFIRLSLVMLSVISAQTHYSQTMATYLDQDGAESTFNLFIKPNGNDSNDGLSWNRAIRTLRRANQILEATRPDRPVNIYLSSGNYGNQTVKWSYYHPVHKTSIRAYNKNDRPYFNGCHPNCVEDEWFQFEHDPGSYTNIELYYMDVQQYVTAVTFWSNRNDPTLYNGNNKIIGCYFRKIGSKYNSKAPEGKSTAVVRLVNSRNNSIVDNHFIHIDNKGVKNNEFLHAVYLAHHASYNLITRNRFKKNTGDPIKTRDAANFNAIRNNIFLSITSKTIYFEKYCDGRVRSICTKSIGECPSYGNKFYSNIIGHKIWEKRPRFYRLRASSNPAPHCHVPVKKRLTCYGNDYRFY